MKLCMNWLRENARQEPYYFGLGFCKLNLKDGSALHFYSTDFKPTVEDEIHSHATHFTSTILKGALHDHRYLFEPSQTGAYAKTFVDCGHESVTPMNEPEVVHGDIVHADTLIHEVGQTYHMSDSVFHSVSVMQDTITHITEKNYGYAAYAITKRGNPVTCAFSVPEQPLSPWEFIERMVDKGRGYHLTDIKKGELGEPSKIFEEVEEFKDALEQGVAVMALVELADAVGAIKAYLAKHHPSITIDDLHRMSRVTERAFQNGLRR